MSVIAQRTEHVAGLARSRGGSGDPSPFTALGVEAAIRATCERAFADSSLRDRSVCVLGLGHVGSRVAKRCARAGARLIVADVDARKRALAEQLGAAGRRPADALEREVDVLVPCALGGLLDDDDGSAPALPRDRRRGQQSARRRRRSPSSCRQRGILWAPDFVANAGGLINIAEELGGYDAAAARRRVRGIGDTLREIFARAESDRRRRRWRRRWSWRAGAWTRRAGLAGSGRERGSDALRASARTLHPGGEPALVRELVQVRRERDRRGRPQLLRHVVPGGVEHLGHRARAGLQRREQPALAIQPVLDVLVELGRRIGHRRPVAGQEHRQVAPAQLAQRLQVPAARRGPAR